MRAAYVTAGAFFIFGDKSERGAQIQDGLNTAHEKEMCAPVNADVRN